MKKAKLRFGPCYNRYNNISDSDYNQTIYKKNQFTYLVPLNEAFENVPKEVLESIMNNVTNLQKLLLGKYHYFFQLFLKYFLHLEIF